MEFDLIGLIRSRVDIHAHGGNGVVLGIGDDAALVQPPPGSQLAITADTLNAGVHFPLETSASDIGWKSLAVNLSDLAAMGAQPAWCTLSLSVPDSDAAWWNGFLDGFLPLAQAHGITLIGGDTTRGPLSIAITAIGIVESGRALRRDGARDGDDIWVSGTLGDAAAALAQWPHVPEPLHARLDRPEPRVQLGRRLIGIANSAIDVSDGLLADLGHVCHASGVGAEIELDRLPASPLLQAENATQRALLQATGGDDYELCFSAGSGQRDALLALAADLALPLTRIGRIVAGNEVRAFDAQGRIWNPQRRGYNHF